jgi:hypothetical protein
MLIIAIPVEKISRTNVLVCHLKMALILKVNKDSIIAEYFHNRYPYNTIMELLKKKGIVMHLRTLKRKLKDFLGVCPEEEIL